MIEKLTAAQEEKLGEYRDKWIAIGLATQNKPMDIDRVSQILDKVYECGGLAAPKNKVHCRSPKEIVEHVLSLGVPKQEIMNSFIYGQHDAGWLGFYEFFRIECGLKKETESMVPLMELAMHTNWCATFEDNVFVSDRPVKVSMLSGKLNCDDGPAVEYSDGFKLFSLNGVSLRNVEHLLDGSATAHDILNVGNAEQRSELIKWYGVEKLFDRLNPELLDSSGNYELYLVPVYQDAPRTYLKMKNPSVDQIHLEAVHPDCKSVDHALQWRNFGSVDLPTTGFEKPVVLT